MSEQCQAKLNGENSKHGVQFVGVQVQFDHLFVQTTDLTVHTFQLSKQMFEIGFQNSVFAI